MDTLRAADAGSFAGTVRPLSATSAAVARLVGCFDAAHLARLFRRSTRVFSLTPDDLAYHHLIGVRLPEAGHMMP